MEKDESLNFIETVSKGNPLVSDDGTIDLDKLAERLQELQAQVESYRASLVRGVTARCGLLGRGVENFGLEGQNIRQLLEIREELDREFRQRFKLTPDIPGETGIEPGKTLRFKCGA